METLPLMMLIFIIDLSAIIIRISAGEWTTNAKLGLLTTHLALVSQVLKLERQ